MAAMSNAPPARDCRIFLRQMSVLCKIGIDPAEREAAQRLMLDVDIAPSAEASSPLPAVDYAEVFHRLQTFAAGKQHALMEDFASEVADILLEEFAIAEVRVRCEKPRPFPGLAAAAAEVIRKK